MLGVSHTERHIGSLFVMELVVDKEDVHRCTLELVSGGASFAHEGASSDASFAHEGELHAFHHLEECYLNWLQEVTVKVCMTCDKLIAISW